MCDVHQSNVVTESHNMFVYKTTCQIAVGSEFQILRTHMHTTPLSLLQRLLEPEPHDAWAQFVRLYTPLLFRWTRQARIPEGDADDLIQEVLLVIFRKLADFQHRGEFSFRNWLRTVALNKWCDKKRSQSHSGTLGVTDIVGPNTVLEWEEAEYKRYLIGRALQIMRLDFNPVTYQACWELIVEERPAAEIATKLGITANAVYLAKFRVMNRLQTELDGLLE